MVIAMDVLLRWMAGHWSNGQQLLQNGRLASAIESTAKNDDASKITEKTKMYVV